MMSVKRLMLILSRHLSTTAKRINDPQTQALLSKILRVDHAGELGAVRIYEGQLAVLGRTKDGPLLQEMKRQEEHHLATFSDLLPKNRVRPTALTPIWNVAGFALGAGTALLGRETAMACTVAIETAIGEHYDSQIRELMADGADGLEKHKELIEIIRKFRDEELGHLETGLENDAERAPFYDVLNKAIQFGCKGAIWLSERV